jgi:hypothetical protein
VSDMYYTLLILLLVTLKTWRVASPNILIFKFSFKFVTVAAPVVKEHDIMILYLQALRYRSHLQYPKVNRRPRGAVARGLLNGVQKLQFRRCSPISLIWFCASMRLGPISVTV